ILFGVLWKKSNLAGMWLSLIGGIIVYIVVVAYTMMQNHINFVEAINPSFEIAVFAATAASLLGMIIGSYIGKPTDQIKLKRFHVIINTPVGDESRLVAAGISLPALVDAGLITNGEEEINVD